MPDTAQLRVERLARAKEIADRIVPEDGNYRSNAQYKRHWLIARDTALELLDRIEALEAGLRWTHVRTPPTHGGHYAVGGYVNDGVLPRRFERTYATCIITLDGPEWSHCNDRKAHVPIEYWFDLPDHPEYAARALLEGERG